MPEPIPDFTQGGCHAAPLTLLHHFMQVYPAPQRAIKHLPDGLFSVAGANKRVVSI